MGFLPRVFNARAGDFYRKIFFATRAKETRELALPEGEKKFDDICTTISTQYRHLTGRQ